jgi:hypothetical protein
MTQDALPDTYRPQTFRDKKLVQIWPVPILDRGKSDIEEAKEKAKMDASKGSRAFRELNRDRREQQAREKARWERLAMGLFGGAALIGPMLIMVLLPSRKVNLITASVATFLFALALAFGGKNLSGQDVLADTAAYTAVLVVVVVSNSSIS